MTQSTIVQPGQAVASPATQSRIQSHQPQTIAANAATIADSVAISETARALADNPNISHEATPQRSWISENAHSDPIWAEKAAYELAKGPDQPLLDISGLVDGSGPIRYTGTGQPVTAESKAYFEQEASRVASERMALYQSEKANGTPAAEIVDKLIAYMDRQPKRYLEMMPWRPYG